MRSEVPPSADFGGRRERGGFAQDREIPELAGPPAIGLTWPVRHGQEDKEALDGPIPGKLQSPNPTSNEARGIDGRSLGVEELSGDG